MSLKVVHIVTQPEDKDKAFKAVVLATMKKQIRKRLKSEKLKCE